jgi:endonuclease YncB( thermonuclease family)
MRRNVFVSKVIDGDTFDTNTNERIRLANVDAPKEGFWIRKAPRVALKEMIEVKPVTIETVATDSFGRLIAEVWCEGVSVNGAMRKILKNGIIG